jgi:PAS domain S-box-containing protein
VDKLDNINSAMPSSGPPGEPLPDTFRTAADHIPGLVWTSLPDGYIDFLNLRWREFTGLTLEQSCGWGWQVAIHPDDLPGLRQTWAAVLRSAAAGEAEARLRRFDGEFRWCSFRAVPSHDAAGQVVKWYGQTLDIDEVKRAEALLAGEKHLLEMLAKGHPLDVILVAICQLIEELAPETKTLVMLLDDAPKPRLWARAAPSLPRSYVEALDGCEVDSLAGPCSSAAYLRETVVASDIAADARWSEYADLTLGCGLRACMSTPIKSSEGKVLGTIAMYFSEPREPTPYQRGVTEQLTHVAAVAVERKRVDMALQISEERFRRMAETTPDVMWITELEPERVVYASPSFERIWGRTLDALYRDPRVWVEGIHPDDRLRIGDAFTSWIGDHGSRHWDAEFRVLRPDGTTRWIHERGVGFTNEGGPRRVSGISTDITERRLAEAALRISEERHALAMQAARDGHWDWVVDSDEYYASPRLIEIYGFPAGTRFSGREDFMGRFPFHPDDRSKWQQAISEHFSGTNARFELEMRMLRHGEVRWIQQSGLLSRDASGRPTRWTGSVRDVTDRRAGEAALRESEQRFALAVSGSNDGIWDLDLTTEDMFMSERAQLLCGLEPGITVRPRSQWSSMKHWHPDDAVSRSDMIEAYLAGRVPAFDGEWRIRHADGNYRWIRIRGVCIRDEAGTPTRIAGSVSDVDPQKRAEAALLQAQRLEATGTLAGGIAHDFNNILAAILGYGEMALRDVPVGSRLRRDLDSILIAAERGRSLVDRILAFSRSGVGERIPVHVEGVLREVLDFLSATLPQNVSIDARLTAGQAAMLGGATQIHQVFMNLATNAIQAMPTGGTLTVVLRVVEIESERLATTGAIAPGEYLQLELADQGSGIAPDDLARIFDPFFTTKDTGVGTGLGLSLVHGIVTEVGGAVDVVSKLGEGSVFTVYLPRFGDAADSSESEAPQMPRGQGQRVLIVDDEASLVTLMTDTLSDLGYRPFGHTSSAAALAAFRARPEDFDVIITDERMPGLSGTALVREVRALRSDIPILLASGFLGGSIGEQAYAAGADEVLQKPLAARELALALARAVRLRQ